MDRIENGGDKEGRDRIKSHPPYPLLSSSPRLNQRAYDPSSPKESKKEG